MSTEFPKDASKHSSNLPLSPQNTPLFNELNMHNFAMCINICSSGIPPNEHGAMFKGRDHGRHILIISTALYIHSKATPHYYPNEFKGKLIFAPGFQIRFAVVT